VFFPVCRAKIPKPPSNHTDPQVLQAADKAFQLLFVVCKGISKIFGLLDGSKSSMDNRAHALHPQVVLRLLSKFPEAVSEFLAEFEQSRIWIFLLQNGYGGQGGR